MISLAKFLGGATHITSTGTFVLSWAFRLHRINTADSGNRVCLPNALRRTIGAPKIVILNDSSVSLNVCRFGESSSPTWTILSGYRAVFYLKSGSTAQGTWVADIRQAGQSTATTKLEAGLVGGSAASTGVVRLQHATDTFTTGATAPNGRIDAASFEVGHELFVGGYFPTASSPASKIDGYKNDTWRQVGSTPISFGAGFGGMGAGLGFFIGGDSEVRNYAFNRRSESWSARTSLGLQRKNGAAASVDGKVYLVAGQPNQAPSMGYAPLLDSLYVLPTYVGTNRRRQSGFGLLGKVYACGGIDDVVGTHDLVDVLDIATLTWSAGPVIPMGARSGGAGFMSNRRGYFGGGQDGSATDQKHIATLRSGSWVSLTALAVNKYRVENSCGASL